MKELERQMRLAWERGFKFGFGVATGMVLFVSLWIMLLDIIF